MPYQVTQSTDKFPILTLTESETGSSVVLCPERGGIALSCVLGGTELFYLDKETFYAPDANIRGGNPVLFPISGQLKNGEYEWEGTVYRMKNHGVARNRPWEVRETSETGQASASLVLKSDSGTRQEFPFDFELAFTYVLQGGKLSIRQQYRNLSDSPMPMYPGFHPYFNADRKAIEYGTDATRYLDLNDNREKPINGTVDLGGKVESFVLLDARKSEISFEASSGVTVKMEYSDSFKYVVLWSVEGKPFVCVEPWMAQTAELNRKEELTFVAPGETLQAELTISRG